MRRPLSYTILALLIGFIQVVTAQSLKPIARSSELTWYGVDYSMVKLVGFEGKLPADRVQNEIVPQIDFSPFEGRDHRKLNRLFENRFTQSNLNYVDGRNNRATFTDSFLEEIVYLEYDEIEVLIDEISGNGNGFGMLCIAEAMDEQNRVMTMWIVYFRESNNEIAFAKRYKADCHDPWGSNAVHNWKSAVERMLDGAADELNQHQ